MFRYDTRLTLEGREQARLASTGAKLLEPKPQVVITSPLTRALSTAQLAFAELTCPRTVEPLCSERLWLSSDVGRQPELLQQEFPQFYFGGLEDIWWHNDGSGNLQHVYAEPTGELRDDAPSGALLLRQACQHEICTKHVGVSQVVRAAVEHAKIASLSARRPLITAVQLLCNVPLYISAAIVLRSVLSSMQRSNSLKVECVKMQTNSRIVCSA